VVGLLSQGRGDDKIIKIAYFLENYIETDDWQCRYIRGRRRYVCRTKQGKKHVLYRELVGEADL
jgi:hypothetical protein